MNNSDLKVSSPSDFIFQNDKIQGEENVKKSFDENGYVIVRNLLSQEEISALRKFLEENNVLQYRFTRNDGNGQQAGLVIWNQPGNDITGMIARCDKMVNVVEKVLEGEVYHYQSNIIMKDKETAGSFVWHQDYGYWYENGILYPDMATVFIGLDRAHQGNGCVKVLRGSHKAGRIDHVLVGGQVGADMNRVEHFVDSLPLDYLEVEPGDAAFFHCNLLHKSEQNLSEERRWAFLVCYNRASNNPVIKHHHAQYTPLQKVPNSAIADCKAPFNPEEKDIFMGQKNITMENITKKTLTK